jgi:YD repeat-containing protein
MNAHEIVQAPLLCRRNPIYFSARGGRLLLSPDHDGTAFRRIAWKGKPFRSLPMPITCTRSAMTARFFSYLKVTTDAVGNIVTATYDVRGRKTASSDPDLGAWTYSYDTASELVSQTDAKNQTSAFSYDLVGRMTTPDGLT